MASLILGVCGKKRSGKDTFAARLVEAHGFTRVAFADPLKAVALDLDPIVVPGYSDETDRRLAREVAEYGWEAAKEIPEVRRVLQALGVAVRDHVDNDAWVDAAFAKADEIDGPVVITDVRFPNEAALVQAKGALIRIVRPGQVSEDQHVSETALDAWIANAVIHNDGTVDDLHYAADGIAALYHP